VSFSKAHSRRHFDFFAGANGARLAAVIPPLEDCSFPTFEALVGKPFVVGNDGPDEKSISLVLTSARRLNHPHERRAEPFSLLFEGPPDSPLEQGAYLFRREGFAGQPIFIVPVSQGNEVRLYEAIFN
jgi:hypothetical protein